MAEVNIKKENWFKRHKIITIVVAVILLLVMISAISGGGTKENTNTETAVNSSATETKKEEASVAGLGQPVKDGKFEFTVNGVECGKTTIGPNEYLTKNAQGQFCSVSVNVKNIGNEAQTLFADNQYLYNASGQKFSADGQATLYSSPQGDAWLAQINPGNSVNGSIVFDIPKDQQPASIVLHDSALSNGVKVNLN